MNIDEEIKTILTDFKHDRIGSKDAIDQLWLLHNKLPEHIVLGQEWYEDLEEKTGWLGSGWNEPDGYELMEIIDSDKFGNPIQAIFKNQK